MEKPDKIPKEYVRRNVYDLFHHDKESYTEFVIALNNFKKSKDYTRICAVHGNSFDRRDRGVLCPTKKQDVIKINCAGKEDTYCPHAYRMFVAWHQPYVYEFELLLNKHSGNQKFIPLPYLYIELNQDYSFLCEETYKYTDDQGNEQTIDNPFYPGNCKYYRKQHDNLEEDDQQAGYQVLVRNGVLENGPQSQSILVQKTIRQLHNCTSAENYYKFSSTEKLNNDELKHNHVPIEQPHNTLHNLIGGQGGSMSDIFQAAYDPVFWLHHCNIERFFQSWLNREVKQEQQTNKKKKIKKIRRKKKKIVNADKIPEEIRNQSLAPFFDEKLFDIKFDQYQYCFKNHKFQKEDFLKFQKMLDLDKTRYKYEVVPELPFVMPKAFINLKNIPVPRESMNIIAYLVPKKIYKKGLKSQKRIMVGQASHFGLNRIRFDCIRCNRIKLNISIELLEFLNHNKIKQNDLDKYDIVIEGEGLLIKKDGKFLKYSQQQIIGDGELEIKLNDQFNYQY